MLPLQVKQSVALEQNRTRTLDLGLAQLTGSVSALQDEDVQLDQQVKTLSTSFQSLLQDAIRHSDVLQLLLGEEVLEFLEWPLQDQEAHSVPALQEQLRRLQERLRSREEAELQEPGAGRVTWNHLESPGAASDQDRRISAGVNKLYF